MHQLNNCPKCQAKLSNWEQKERECFTCGWSEEKPKVNEYDREIDDDSQD